MTGDLRDLIAQLVDELEQLADRACTYGQFHTCTKSGDCVRRRALIAAGRTEAPALLDAIDSRFTQLTSVPELRRK